MRRLGSSNSLGALISICPSTEEKSTGGNHVYSSRGFQSMLDSLDEEDCLEESGLIAEKKRRLSVDQVKALEKNFEVENKLEPERKVKLAQELGLQPRQVAVWFQNRRARWKTKQLERDYGLLKAKYDDLKLNYDAIQRDKEALLAELRELKSKIQGENKEGNNISIKEEKFLVSEVENKATEQSNRISAVLPGEEPEKTEPKTGVPMVFGDFKDGSSDSDTSAILNEESSPNVAISSSGVGVFNQQHNQLISSLPSSSTLRFNCSSTINCLPISDSRAILANTQKGYQQQQQFVRMEEHNFFSGEDSCSFFSDDQAPTLPWYYSDQWS